MKKKSKYKKPVYSEEDRQIACRLASKGIRVSDIAYALNLSETCLLRLYRDDMKAARTEAIERVADTVYEKALKGDKACMFFYLKTTARFRESGNNDLEHTETRSPKQQMAQIKNLEEQTLKGELDPYTLSQVATTRMKRLAKQYPELYGDRVGLDHSSTDGTMTPHVIDLSSLTIDERIELAKQAFGKEKGS